MPKTTRSSDRVAARPVRARKSAPVLDAAAADSSAEVPVMSAEILDGSPAIPQVAEPPVNSLPTHEEIAAHAYVISETRRRAGIQGDEVSDWYQAERELYQGAAR